MTGFSASRVLPVDTRNKDWGREMAREVNSLLKANAFAFFITTTPSSSEVMCIHPVMADCFIPADWGSRIETVNSVAVTRYQGVEWSCDVHPVASWAMDIKRKPLGSSTYASIGTWTMNTSGNLTAVTAGNKVIPLTKGDVLKFIAPASADGTIADTAFTIIGIR